jgi:uncharacterized membrane protein YgcG
MSKPDHGSGGAPGFNHPEEVWWWWLHHSQSYILCPLHGSCTITNQPKCHWYASYWAPLRGASSWTTMSVNHDSSTANSRRLKMLILRARRQRRFARSQLENSGSNMSRNSSGSSGGSSGSSSSSSSSACVFLFSFVVSFFFVLFFLLFLCFSSFSF